MKRFYRRRFLNRRGFHAGAYVLASCEIDAYRFTDGPTSYAVDAELVLADCGRIVTLDFRADNEAAVRNALYKARLLRDVTADFTTALESTVEHWRGLRS